MCITCNIAIKSRDTSQTTATSRLQNCDKYIMQHSGNSKHSADKKADQYYHPIEL